MILIFLLLLKFFFKVSFLIPDVEISKELTKVLNVPFYEIQYFKVADLLAKNTIDGYINNGDFFLISQGSSSDNVSFSISEKKLSIEIEKELFYSLGAVHLTRFQKEVVNEIHKFEVDLSYVHLEKIRNELNSKLIDKISIFFSWHPSSIDTCPSSVAKYFSDMGYIINGHKNQLKIEPQYGLRMPPAELDFNDVEEMTSFSERIGMILLNCDMTTIIDENLIKVGRGKVVHWKGFITNNQLNELIKLLQAIKYEKSFPYMAISLIPFIKTVNCTPRTLILLNSNDYLILQ